MDIFHHLWQATRMRWLGFVAAAMVVMTAGCLGGPGSGPTTGAPPGPGTDTDDLLPWAAGEPHFVVVRKSCRTLDVYEHGRRLMSHPAVFGLAGTRAQKLYEGDLRTPSGLYMVVGKRRHPRWRHFLLLDYPNIDDLHRHWLAMEEGRIPRRGGRYAGAGGAVGIHGTDKPDLNRRGVDWTLGCISLDNDAIDQVARAVPVGTLVLIED